MLEFIQVTAQYSNAVLLAIMPHVSDFAKRAAFPLPAPVGLRQVAEFKCFPVKDQVGGLVILTNGYRVWFHNGYVTGFRTAKSYYNLQDPRDIPRFYGPLKMTKDEALTVARNNIVNLGYTLEETFTDQEPEIDVPPIIGTNIVPHFRFRWKDPVFSTTAVSIEVDAGRTVIQEINLLSPFLWRSGPKISLEPKVRNPMPAVATLASNQFVSRVLPKITEFSRKLDLPVRLPVDTGQIERIVFVGNQSDVRIKLTNGYWFSEKNGVMIGFNAPDSIYGRQPILEPLPRPFREYLGTWNFNESQSIELVRQAIRKFGYSVEQFNANRAPDITRPDSMGKYVVPRFSFRWLTNTPDTHATLSLVRAEVDADQGKLKYFELIGPNLALTGTGESHRIGPAPTIQSMVFDTNAVSRFQPEEELTDFIKYLQQAMPVVTNKSPRTSAPKILPPNLFE